MQKYEDPLVIGGKQFQSRLIVGTGKYPTLELMQQCHEASGADMVTVAVRRMELPGTSKTLMDYIDRDRFYHSPEHGGLLRRRFRILTARLAREAGLSDFVKLEVIGDQKTLFPDVEELLKATRTLAKEGFIVMPYTNDDPITAKKLEDAGAAGGHAPGGPYRLRPGNLQPL
jgi:thiazole synthase